MAADGHFATQNALRATPDGASPGSPAPLLLDLKKSSHGQMRHTTFVYKVYGRGMANRICLILNA